LRSFCGEGDRLDFLSSLSFCGEGERLNFLSSLMILCGEGERRRRTRGEGDLFRFGDTERLVFLGDGDRLNFLSLGEGGERLLLDFSFSTFLRFGLLLLDLLLLRDRSFFLEYFLLSLSLSYFLKEGLLLRLLALDDDTTFILSKTVTTVGFTVALGGGPEISGDVIV